MFKTKCKEAIQPSTIAANTRQVALFITKIFQRLLHENVQDFSELQNVEHT